MSKAGRPKAEIKKEKIVSIRMKPEDYARVKRYAESSNKTVTQVMQEGVTKLIEEDKRDQLTGSTYLEEK